MPAKDAGFKTVDEQAGYIPDHVDLRTITVLLSEISVATQPHLNPDLVSQYAAGAPKRKPLLRSWGGGIAVLNGHHTIAAARHSPSKTRKPSASTSAPHGPPPSHAGAGRTVRTDHQPRRHSRARLATPAGRRRRAEGSTRRGAGAATWPVSPVPKGTQAWPSSSRCWPASGIRRGPDEPAPSRRPPRIQARAPAATRSPRRRRAPPPCLAPRTSGPPGPHRGLPPRPRPGPLPTGHRLRRETARVP